MKGDVVIVRAFGGMPLVRRVWAESGETIAVASEDVYLALEAGKTAPIPIGFPSGSVYPYDPETAHKLASGRVKWADLRALVTTR